MGKMNGDSTTHREETAHVSIDFVVGEICFNVSILVTCACIGKRVNYGCLRLCSGGYIVRGLPGLRAVLGIFLRAETEASAASRSRFVGTRLWWFCATLCGGLSSR